MRALATVYLLCIVIAAAGCGGGGSPTNSAGATGSNSKGSGSEAAEVPGKTKPTVEVPVGPPPKQLVIEDLEEGSGAAVRPGNEVAIHYVGVEYKTDRQFISTWDEGKPYSFRLGASQVIPPFEEGVEGMRVGGRREIIIPARLAYGKAGRTKPAVIEPNATLLFVVDLLRVSK